MPTAYNEIQTLLRSERNSGMAAGAASIKAAPDALAELERSLAKGEEKRVGSAMQELRRQMVQAKRIDAAARGAFALVNLESNVSSLVGETLKYNLLPDADTEAFLRAAVPQMREAAQNYPAPIREAVDNLLAHIEAILRQGARQVELLREIARVPVTERIDVLSQAFINRFDAELEEQARFQKLLVYYSGFALLAIIAAVGYAIYSSATEFKRMAKVVDETRAALQQSEAQLVHAEKMSMLGEIVSGIAHEINTPLGYLRSGLESAKENLSAVMTPYTDATERMLALMQAPGAHRAELQQLYAQLINMQKELRELDILTETTMLLNDGIDGVGHINETVVNLLNFSRLDRNKVTLFKLETGIDSTLKLANHFLKNKNVVKRYGETRAIHCDLSQLNQVFLNVVKNAAQATPHDSGEIVIATSMADDDMMRVDISDNGNGIAPEHLPRIFEAFFTTKKEGSGTGLGLSISRKIVESHGGRIEVDSTVGVGTTFSIYLPVNPPVSLLQDSEPSAVLETA